MLKTITVASLLAISSVGASAASSNATLTVTATVVNVCVIGDATMLFGGVGLVTNAVGVSSTPAVDATVQVPVTCTNGTNASIAAGLGQNANGSVRRMKHALNSAAFMAYELYKDSNRTQVFGSGADAISYTGTGTADLLNVYGRITGSSIETALPGPYLDSVAIVLTYTP